MKQQRVELWSAASFACAPSSLRSAANAAPYPISSRVDSALARLLGTQSSVLDVLSTTTGRIALQDGGGLNGEVLLPDPAITDAMMRTTDAAAQRTIASAYNDWVAQHQAGASHRIIAVGLIPTSGIDDAESALGQCQSLGLAGVSLVHLPAGEGSGPGESEDFFRQASNRTVIVLGPHYGGFLYADRVAPRVAAGRPSPQTGILLRLALTGLLDDEPDLRFVIAGVDAGWIPFELAKADTNYLRTRATRSTGLRREDALPSEYVREHTFATFSEDRAGATATDYFGESHLMWSTAAPTSLSAWPDDEEQSARLTYGMSTDLRRVLLGENCRRVFRHDGVASFTAEELGAFQRPVLV
jgi:predicted TIM-barrel fold metal-dependent hydrolase